MGQFLQFWIIDYHFDFWILGFTFMQIVSAHDKDAIRHAIKVLQRGGVIVYPTETAYGLGGDWTNRSVHRAVRAIKGRPAGKELSVIVSSAAMAGRYVKLNRAARALAKEYWPGPLSLVLPLRQGSGTLSLRISPHPLAQRLVRSLGRPLIATSANVSGSKTLYNARVVVKEFAGCAIKPDLVLDAGGLPQRKPSTVVRVYEDGSIEVLREGLIRINVKIKNQKSK